MRRRPQPGRAGRKDFEQVGGKNNPGGVVVANLPSRLEVVISSETHRGHTSWDPERVIAVEEPLPATFDVNHMTEVAQDQTRALRKKMAERLGKLEAQAPLP